jgi:Rieske Fe-S protein
MSLDIPDRRTVLRGVAIIGAGAALSACGSTSSSGTSGTPAPAGTKLGSASDIPVGGGKIFAAEKVVVTQPSTGTFKAFSAVCTHQGCVVSSIEKEEIRCNCHGSVFSLKDGSVLQGPASSPLAAEAVTDEGGILKLA